MAEEKRTEDECKVKCSGGAGMGSGVYGLAFLGAAYYFLQNADSFIEGVLGIIKAVFWPAVLIYKWLEFLQM